MSSHSSLVPEEKIIKKILVIRGEKVLLDLHLAELYGVETRTLKQAVRRNRNRFPDDFMFELELDEVDLVVSQNVIPHKKYFGGAVPYAFTEAGVAMLSSVLRSNAAIEVNIAIVRSFIALRKMALNYEEIMNRLHKIEKDSGEKFSMIFEALERLLRPENPSRKRIGYKKD